MRHGKDARTGKQRNVEIRRFLGLMVEPETCADFLEHDHRRLPTLSSGFGPYLQIREAGFERAADHLIHADENAHGATVRHGRSQSKGRRSDPPPYRTSAKRTSCPAAFALRCRRTMLRTHDPHPRRP